MIGMRLTMGMGAPIVREPEEPPAREKLVRQIEDIAGDHWPRIDRAVGDRLRQIGEPGVGDGSVLRGVWPKGGWIGCGWWGCTYPIATTKRWVIKITTDLEEVSIINSIKEYPHLLNHPGIARFDMVWELDGSVRVEVNDELVERPVRVILREAVTPLLKRKTVIAPARREEISDILQRVRKWSRKAAKKAETAEYYARIGDPRLELQRDRLRHDLVDLTRTIEKLSKIRYTKSIAEFMQLYMEYVGTPIGDVNIGNVGFRDYNLGDVFHGAPAPIRNRLVIFDAGDIMADESAVPMLPNGKRRRSASARRK